jgi:hypothetical protein
MPRKPSTDHYLYGDLEQYIIYLESNASQAIAALKNELAELQAKTEYQKAKAIMQAVKSGLSIYATAKAAGIKSSTKRLNLVENAEKVIAEYESEAH